MDELLKDPEYTVWLEERIEESRRAQDAEMEAKHEEKREYWLNKTEGEDPC